MVNVICMDLTLLPPSAYEALYENATDDRKSRADRYLRREDALRCLVSGALLRDALGCTDYKVAQSPWGKPCIPARPGFHFNLSHSGRWVVLAWADEEIGVDVEEIPRDAEKAALARRYFTADEQSFVFASADGIARRFTEIWTKKESYLKYLGTGLSKSLKSFSVLSPELSRNFLSRTLEGGYCLSLYCPEQNCTFDFPDSGRIL